MNQSNPEPVLVNSEGHWTVHRFTRTELVEIAIAHELVDGTSRLTRSTGIASVFTCSETGAERRWGIK